MNCLVVPEVADKAVDYQSGSKHPHSKGSAVHCQDFAHPNTGLRGSAFFSKTIKAGLISITVWR